MIRQLFCSIILLSAIASIAIADTYVEKVKTVDTEGKTISILIDKKEKVFNVDSKAQILTQIRAGKKVNVTPIKDGLKAIKAGDELVITTELKAGEEVITKVVRALSATTPKKSPSAKKE